jgi:1-acyl-sn-glycerol-3-phosphate acyltransferase
MPRIAYLYMRVRGWEFIGSRPTQRKFVAIGAPHTCNFDFIAFLAVSHRFDFKASFIGKHTLFKPPFGTLMRKLGGIPVRRDSGQGMVEQLVAAYAAADDLVIMIAPEGTRGAARHWRSGFHTIATSAGLVIAPCWVDYPNKRIGVGPVLHPSPDRDADMRLLAAFYSDKGGAHPENQTPVTLG